MKYNARLRELSIQRKQNVYSILVEARDGFDDERITEKEAPLLRFDFSWLEDEEIFNVDVSRIVLQKRQRDSSTLIQYSFFTLLQKKT